MKTVMMHLYKWTIADMLSGKNIFSKVDLVITNSKGATGFYLM